MKVAITGGIGSGKTTVAQYIKSCGYEVFSCDEIYKTLLTDGNILELLAKEFGNEIITEGKLDREYLSSIVFSDKKKLKRLNDITHPLIMQRALKEMEGIDVSFCEVPLLFENGYEKLFDKVIVVLRNKAARINAVSERDNISVNDIEKRLNNQIIYDNNAFTEYYVIHNDFDLTDLKKQTDKILNDIINL